MTRAGFRKRLECWGHRVENTMGNDDPVNRSILEKTLYGLSRIYGLGARLQDRGFERGLFAEHRLPCRVISVGNLTTGGSGKTPMTHYLALMLGELGLQPAIISRGYKGRMEKAGGVVSDGRDILVDPEQAGDEPYMLASQMTHIPVLVGADRYAMGRYAISRFSPDVILLDDAFQHRRLYRDINLLVVDAGTGFGNGHLLPRGILREPLDALGRADLVVITGAEKPFEGIQALISRIKPGIPVFRAVSAPFIHGVAKSDADPPLELEVPDSPEDFGFLKQCRVLAFSGIARNQAFKQMIAGMAGDVPEFLEFPDHHAYSPGDLNQIARRAVSVGAHYIVTTQKDFVRIRGRVRFPVNLAVIGIHADFGEDQRGFAAYFETRLSGVK